MDETNFSMLIFGIIFCVIGAILWRSADSLEDRFKYTFGEKVGLFLLLLLIGVGAVGLLALTDNFLARPIYLYFLRENPLVLARISLVGMSLFMLIGMLVIGKLLFWDGYFERMRSRINEAQYLDQKLGQMLVSLFPIGVGLLYLSLPALLLYGIVTKWDNMNLWKDTIREMQTSVSAPAPAPTDPLPLALAARRKTCLYENPDLSGGCAFSQAAGTYVLPYISLEPNLGHKQLISEQKGTTIYVVSIDPHTVLQPGWVRQSDYNRLDVLEGFLATFSALFNPEVLKSALVDLAIGSAISFVIVLITQGAAEHYLLSLVLFWSIVSTAVRFSISEELHLIVPPWVLWLAIIPLAIGAALEHGIIKLLRRFGM